jgi:hypothetical protein
MYQTQPYPCSPPEAPACWRCGCQPCRCGSPMVGPYEISVASGGTSAQALVGGTTIVHLSLEYLVDSDASSPSVTVTTASDGTTSTWQETTPGTGYQVKADFMNVAPGTVVTVDATEAAARLRWCETFCC